MCCSLPVVSSPVLNLARDGNDDGSAVDLNIFAPKLSFSSYS